jgi:hypothetical protein
MSIAAESSRPSRLGPWAKALLYGVLQFAIYGVAAFLVEKYSGSCMFVLPAYFYALVTVLAVVTLRRFGVGAATFLPIAVLGGLMEYYMEWVSSRSLLSPWGALAWSAMFLGIGLAADVAFRLAPARWSLRRRAALTGVAFGLAFYLLVLLVLVALYPHTAQPGHLKYFLEGAPFTVPWMLVNGGFAGYTAAAIADRG